ncbi:MAG: hypothetical protein GQ470_01700 [Gammaproteobacteria bacterium]|nr:hypothetical protein [Gammaproteobacteria bacterium]
MLNKNLLIILFSSLLGACSSAYIIPDGASSNQVFQEACSGCHKVKESPEIFFKIKAQNRNISTISNKISGGSLIMPGFPNIRGRELQGLSEYVLSHSIEK